MGKNDKNKSFRSIKDDDVVFTDSELVNEVRTTAIAYLEHAENAYQFEFKKGVDNWLFVGNWFVVHHLCYISVEIFLKSFHTKYIVIVHQDYYEDDVNESVHVMADVSLINHSIVGHFDIHKEYPEALLLCLKNYLSTEEWLIIESMSFDELTRGRYPYEENAVRVSQEDVLKYLNLAKKLSNFKYYD